jgi:hypothetical protein
MGDKSQRFFKAFGDCHWQQASKHHIPKRFLSFRDDSVSGVNQCCRFVINYRQNGRGSHPQSSFVFNDLAQLVRVWSWVDRLKVGCAIGAISYPPPISSELIALPNLAYRFSRVLLSMARQFADCFTGQQIYCFVTLDPFHVSQGERVRDIRLLKLFEDYSVREASVLPLLQAGRFIAPVFIRGLLEQCDLSTGQKF